MPAPAEFILCGSHGCARINRERMILMFAKDASNQNGAPRSVADKVVETEIKVCTDRTCSEKQSDSASSSKSDSNSNANSSCDCSSSSASSCDCECPTTLAPAARELAEEMYENVTMGTDSYLHMLPHVENDRLKTDMSAALCYYEKLTGKIRDVMQAADVEPREKGMMAKMAARAGIVMNTMTDKTTSHIAEMLIEGCTMSVTTATKLQNHYADKTDCSRLVGLCTDWAKFEEEHIERLKAYL